MTVEGAGPVRAKLQEIVPEHASQTGGLATQEEIVAGRPLHRKQARFGELETSLALPWGNFLPLFKQRDSCPALHTLNDRASDSPML